MPRRKAVDTDTLTDQSLPGLEGLDQDPAPRATRGRPRKTTTAPPTKAAGNRGRISTRGTTGRIMSKAQMQSKVAEEVYTYLSLAAAGWELRDPECASTLYESVTVPTSQGPQQMQRLAAIADRLVAMISRNDKLLARMATSGVIGEMAVMLHLVVPIARTAWQAHGPSGQGHNTNEGGQDAYADRFPAYQPAA